MKQIFLQEREQMKIENVRDANRGCLKLNINGELDVPAGTMTGNAYLKKENCEKHGKRRSSYLTNKKKF